jgi:hypothetical protein
MDLFGMESIPPPPSPDGQYVWVKTKEGSFWRKKRGSYRRAVLNEAYQRSSEATKICSPAASRIVRRLHPYLTGLQTGRLTVRICGRLRKALNEKGRLCFSYLKGLDMQQEYPLEKLLKVGVRVEQDARELRVSVPVNVYTVKRHSEAVSAYYFELILLWGDAGNDKGLWVDVVDSVVYRIGEDYGRECRLSLVLPPEGETWVVLLKVSCIEGKDLAMAPRNYGMKVLACG